MGSLCLKILLGVVGIVIYAVYKTCVDSPSMEDREYGTGSTGGGGMGGGGWTNPGGYGGNTGGYGANQDYHQGGGADCGGARQRGTGAAGGGGGGFWTGAGLGGTASATASS